MSTLQNLRFTQLMGMLRLKPFDTSTSQGRSNERYRRAILSSVLTATGRAANIVVGLISVPLTLHYLGAERFGLWMTITTTVSILRFADLGIGNGLINYLAEAYGRDDRNLMRLVMASGMEILGAVSLVIVAAFVAISAFISWPDVFNAKTPITVAEATPTVTVVLLAFAANIMLSAVVRAYMAFQEGYINGVWQVIGNVLGLSALLIAIQLGLGLPSLVTCIMFGPILAVFFSGLDLFFRRHPWIRPTFRDFDLSIAKRLVGLGVWFFLFQVAYTVHSAVPNLVIARVLDLESVAIFAVAMKLASLAVVVQTVILTPLWPAYTEAKNRRDWSWVVGTLKKSFLLSTGVGIVAASVLVIFGRYIILVWAGSNVVPTKEVLWGLAAWVLLNSMYGPLTMFLNGMGKIRIQALFAIVFVAMMLISCVVLTSRYGLSGTAWSYGVVYTLPSVVVTGIISYRIVNNSRGVDFR